jgi:predicted transcriptional regulator
MAELSSQDQESLVALTCDVVGAYVSKNALSASDLPKLIGEVHQALASLGTKVEPVEIELLKPPVSIRKSVTPEYLICLEDGKKFKSLKRHLSQLGMTPAQYREKWNLPADYPMVAPSYSETRSQLARANGLGRKAELPVPVRKGRKAAVAS